MVVVRCMHMWVNLGKVSAWPRRRLVMRRVTFLRSLSSQPPTAHMADECKAMQHSQHNRGLSKYTQSSLRACTGHSTVGQWQELNTVSGLVKE